MKKTFYIIIRGPLGCGKSTISRRLAKDLHAKYISVDRIVDDSSLIIREKEKGYISQKNFIQANEIAVNKIRNVLDSGKSVVFDGNFYWKSQIDDLIKRLEQYKHYVFTLKAPLEVCISRDAAREKSHGKDAAEAVYKKSTSFNCGIIINTKNKDINETLREIEKRIGRRR